MANVTGHLDELRDLFENNFLQEFAKPALADVEKSECLANATICAQILCTNLTHAKLCETLVKFFNGTLLDILIFRLRSKDLQVGLAHYRSISPWLSVI